MAKYNPKEDNRETSATRIAGIFKFCEKLKKIRTRKSVKRNQRGALHSTAPSSLIYLGILFNTSDKAGNPDTSPRTKRATTTDMRLKKKS